MFVPHIDLCVYIHDFVCPMKLNVYISDIMFGTLCMFHEGKCLYKLQQMFLTSINTIMIFVSLHAVRAFTGSNERTVCSLMS